MLLSYLKLLTDPRQQGKVKYALEYIVMFSIIAICCGGCSLEHIATFIKINMEILKEEFGVEWRKAPGYTTIRKILLVINELELEEVFEMYVGEKYAEDIKRIKRVSTDGKWIRGSINNKENIAAFQLISVFASQFNLILSQEGIEGEKTNEIPIVQSIVKRVILKEVVIGADALHCQKETIRIIKESGNEALIQVKENQGSLLRGMQRAANTINNFSTAVSCGEVNRGRIESRECSVFNHLLPFDGKIQEEWQFTEFVRIQRDVSRKDYTKQTYEQSGETSFYLSTGKHSAQWYLENTRSHWAIENKSHYKRDVDFMEDACRIKKKPIVMAILRSFAFNAVTHTKRYKSTKQSLYANSLQTAAIISYLKS